MYMGTTLDIDQVEYKSNISRIVDAASDEVCARHH
jgi:hypothetical protein